MPKIIFTKIKHGVYEDAMSNNNPANNIHSVSNNTRVLSPLSITATANSEPGSPMNSFYRMRLRGDSPGCSLGVI